MTPAERELSILTIERLLAHLKRQGAAAPGTSPFSPAEAYALIRGLRTIKQLLFPSDPIANLPDSDDPPPPNPHHAT